MTLNSAQMEKFGENIKKTDPKDQKRPKKTKKDRK